MKINKNVDWDNQTLRVEAEGKFVECKLLIPFGRQSLVERLVQKGQKIRMKDGETVAETNVTKDNDVNLYLAKCMIKNWSKENKKIDENTIYNDTELVVGLRGKGKPKSLIKEAIEEIKEINGLTGEDELDYREEIEELFNDAGADIEANEDRINNMSEVLEEAREVKN